MATEAIDVASDPLQVQPRTADIKRRHTLPTWLHVRAIEDRFFVLVRPVSDRLARFATFVEHDESSEQPNEPAAESFPSGATYHDVPATAVETDAVNRTQARKIVVRISVQMPSSDLRKSLRQLLRNNLPKLGSGSRQTSDVRNSCEFRYG